MRYKKDNPSINQQMTEKNMTERPEDVSQKSQKSLTLGLKNF